MQRRAFVTLLAAGGGALALGFGTREVGAAAASRSPFAPNQWLRIDPSGRITVAINKAEMGQGVATGLATIVADELDASLDNVTIELAPAEDRFNDPQSGRMSTGGSTSMRDMWMPMRLAGASARTMLVAAAASEWGVPATQCTTSSGSVMHAASGRTATYGSLVTVAVTQPVPESPQLKSRSQWTLIGKRNARIDARGKLDGSVRYGIDVRAPSMLFATVIRCPVFGGKVASFDAREAMKIKGVRAVRAIWSGVAIVADNTWTAMQARSAVRIVWDEGANAHLDTATLFEEAERLSKGQMSIASSIGDVGAVRGTVIEATYRGPFLAHATMEPMNATADVRSDGCTVWAPTQAPTACRAVAQRVSGLPLERVRFFPTYLGGGFGRRNETDYVQDAVEISKAIGKPVQVVWTREEDIQHDFYRPMSLNVLRAVLSSSGDLVAFSHDVVSPANGRMALNGARPPYAIPNLQLRYAAQDHGIPIGSWRAPGCNWNVFVVETFIDELARAAKRDPVAFRLQMLQHDARAAAVVKLASERGQWGRPAVAGRARGFALGLWNGTYAAMVAEAGIVDGVPKVYRATVAVDCGTVINPDIVRAQVQSAVNYGLAAALTSKITLKNGRVEQENFHNYVVLRHREAPTIECYTVDSDAAPTGIGEPATPVTAPAVANALFELTGKRVRSLPLSDALA